jgi:MFS family permease
MPYGTSLDWLNFLLADVRGGLGPYVSVFLLTEAGWDQATIGAVLTMSGLIGITMHTPMGMIIDATHSKRALLVGGVGALSGCALAIAWNPTVPVVLGADIIMALLGGVFAPTVAAITLGLVEPVRLGARLGRNVAFDRIGNLAIAAIAGAVGTAFSQRAVFYLVPFFAVLTMLAVLSIPASAIDHERARGLDSSESAERVDAPASWRVLLTQKSLLVLAAATAIFHFANAPMLALASQKLALSHPGHEAALTSSAIIVAQLATIPVALLAGWANVLGRKPLLVAAFLALPARALLFAYADNGAWIIAGQILDGLGGGLFDALLPLVLADIMRGTGRYNVSRGFISTVQGIGGSVSHAVAGTVVVRAGYEWAFLGLALIALSALLLVALAMPETRSRGEEPLPAAKPQAHNP